MKLSTEYSPEWGKFFISIVLPTIVAILLSLCAIYLFIIPAFEKSFIDGRKEMIQQLTKVAWNVMDFYQQKEESGALDKEDGQARALEVMEAIRYGEEDRDYFWVIDSLPSLIMHPYSKELLGVDLRSYEDTQGKKIFVEIRETVARQSSGFIDYIWSRKYSEEVAVPKLSYVMLFEPWDWVVGTGVYLDDIELRTAQITRRLSILSLFAVILLAMILFYVGRQSYLVEKRKNRAKEELEKSRIKYKNLVETATEAILMFHGKKCIYANLSALSTLGYSGDEILGIEPQQLFLERTEAEQSPTLPDDLLAQGKREVVLRTKENGRVDALITVSQMNIEGREVAVVSLQDISGRKIIEQELGESRKRYQTFTASLDIGVFRTGADTDLTVYEANESFYSLLNIREYNDEISFKKLLETNIKPQGVYKILSAKGYLKNFTIELRDNDIVRNISLSLVLQYDDENQPLFYDGVIEDITEQVRRENERERLIVDLQTSLQFLNQPIRYVSEDFLGCSENDSIFTAAKMMKNSRSSAILVQNAEGEVRGIVTDSTLRNEVVATGQSIGNKVSGIMTSPVMVVEESVMIFEAVMLMQDNSVKHLAVKNSVGEIVRIISNENLLNVQRYSSTFLIQEILEAEDIEAVIVCHERMPLIIKSLVESGGQVKNITRITGKITETLITRLIELGIKELGDPPTAFAFLSLGSEGRKEQTLATDQDNALIYADVPEDMQESVSTYFMELSTVVCTWLDQAGYKFCTGGVMAMNSKWCQPLTVWKQYFSTWITEAKPQDLLEVSIFFDFRCMYGEKELASDLRMHISKAVAHRDVFFYQLAQNALLFKVPVDFFGNITVESGGDHPNTFNIKHVIALIVGYARLYAITFALDEPNTLLRLEQLKEKNFISTSMHADIVEAYNYLMQIRFKHQVKMMDNGLEPDNFIPLSELSYMEKNVLKKIFSQVGELQSKLNNIGKMEIFF